MIGCSAIARWLPSGDRRTRLTLPTRARTRPTGNSTRYPSSGEPSPPERTTAKSEPSAAQSAAPTPLRTSLDGPPDSGARARTPPRRKATSPEGETAATEAPKISSARESLVSGAATCRPWRPPSQVPEYTTCPPGPKRAAPTDPRRNVMRWNEGGSAGGEGREGSHARMAIVAATRSTAATSAHHARGRVRGEGARTGSSGQAGGGSAGPGARGSTATGLGHSRTAAGAVTLSTAPPTHR